MKTTPLVTSISTHLRKNIEVNDTKIKTPEEIKSMKMDMLGIVEEATKQFMRNLQDGKVELTSTLDLDRLVKLALLLSGEPDSINKSTQQSTLETEINNNITASTSKIIEVLDLEDPSVKAIYEKLFDSYNQINDNK